MAAFHQLQVGQNVQLMFCCDKACASEDIMALDCFPSFSHKREETHIVRVCLSVSKLIDYTDGVIANFDICCLRPYPLTGQHGTEKQRWS